MEEFVRRERLARQPHARHLATVAALSHVGAASEPKCVFIGIGRIGDGARERRRRLIVVVDAELPASVDNCNVHPFPDMTFQSGNIRTVPGRIVGKPDLLAASWIASVHRKTQIETGIGGISGYRVVAQYGRALRPCTVGLPVGYTPEQFQRAFAVLRNRLRHSARKPIERDIAAGLSFLLRPGDIKRCWIGVHGNKGRQRIDTVKNVPARAVVVPQHLADVTGVMNRSHVGWAYRAVDIVASDAQSYRRIAGRALVQRIERDRVRIERHCRKRECSKSRHGQCQFLAERFFCCHGFMPFVVARLLVKLYHIVCAVLQKSSMLF